MKAPTVGVGLLKVLGKLASVRLNVGLVFGRLATFYLFLALCLGHEFVKFVLALGSINMHTLKSSGASSGE